MNTQEFLLWEMRSRDTIDVKRCYVDIAGDLVSGVLLSQIIYWHLPDEQGRSKLRVHHDGHDWLAKKRDDWWHECRISPKQFDRAAEILEKRNLIITHLYRFDGSPTKHIRMDWDGFFHAMKSLQDNDFPQRSKSNSSPNPIFPKGQNPNSPNRKLEMDERERTITETPAETLSKITFSPLTPAGGKSESESVLVEVVEEEEVSPHSSQEQPDRTSALTKKPDLNLDKSSGRVATKQRRKGLTKEELQYFLEAYRAEKPSNFVDHKDLSEKHAKAIAKLANEYGDRSLEIFAGALIWVREQKNDWWRKESFALDNLISNGKLIEYADKHFFAMESDKAYCDRVEGRASSSDKARNNGFSMINENGERMEGASAACAQAVAEDDMLRFFLEAKL